VLLILLSLVALGEGANEMVSGQQSAAVVVTSPSILLFSFVRHALC